MKIKDKFDKVSEDSMPDNIDEMDMYIQSAEDYMLKN